MKIALVGSTGYIAGFLIERFNENKAIESVLKIGHSITADKQLSLTEPELFDYSLLNDVDYVIFTAAVSSPDRCASDDEVCWKINVEGTSYFIEKALQNHCRVLFFSSDAVFGDIPGCIYDEKSQTQPKTAYGKMKKAVEDRFKEECNFKVIRLSYVTSSKDKFVSYCLSCLRSGTPAEVFHPFYRNCISVSDVVDVVEWLINHWDSYKPFALNVAGKELVSRVRIADEINRISGEKLKYVIVQPEDNFYRNRPQITQMRSIYLDQYDIIENNTFTEKIQKELGELSL